MLWLILILSIIIYHGNLGNQFYFVLIKTLEVLLIFDALIFISGIIKNDYDLEKNSDLYFFHDTLRLKLRFKRKMLIRVMWKIIVKRKSDPKVKTFKIKNLNFVLKDLESDRYTISLARLKFISPLGFFVFFKKGGRELSLNVYPLKKECDIDVFSRVEESEALWQKGQDYSEPSGFHEAREGDDIRYIHPYLSAKKGEYIIKEGSSFHRNIYHFDLDPSISFKEGLESLAKIIYLFEKVVYANKETLIVHYDEDYYLRNYDELYRFLDHFYEVAL